MEKSTYLPRIVDSILEERLQISSAVLIEGSKWCGKTTTADRAAKSHLYMQDPDRAASYAKTVDTKPSLLLQGETPRLLDEWQTSPVLWDAVRFLVDQRGGIPGQFILTGSAVPSDGLIHHSGTGRISRLMMRPMSLFESLESNGKVSLQDLFNGKTEIAEHSDLSIEDTSHAIVRGGWPASVKLQSRAALRQAMDYVDSVIEADISRVDGVKKDPMKVRALMRSISRNVSTTATLRTLRDDLAAGEDDSDLSEKTISQYLSVLNRIFVVEDLLAWNPALRSKAAIRTTPKRHFVDPSIATGVLRLTPERLLDDFEYFGVLFESLCTRDLRIYAQANDGELYHYRDSSNLEIDTVVCLHDGRWAPIEIKLGAKEIEKAALDLLELKSRIDLTKMQKPSFLMILTNTEYAYQREDGVFIVPIGCLKN